ncbi:unnamed protein product [Victoria cruziana]
MVDSSGEINDKLAYFQAVTGIEDAGLCEEILEAHGWNLETAVSAITATASGSAPSVSAEPADDAGSSDRGRNSARSLDEPSEAVGRIIANSGNPPTSLAWKVIQLPFSVISGGLGLVSSAVGLGIWIAGGVLSHSLGALSWAVGRGRGDSEVSPLLSLSAGSAEALRFIEAFEREYGGEGRAWPNFVANGFMEALQTSQNSFKLLFVYLHSPDHPDTPVFCEGTLCSQVVAEFVNENFVSWGGSIRASEGFKMSNSLKASRFPFCAIVMAAANQRIALLQQIEGPKSPQEFLTILQKVVEESAPVLVAARLDEEERRNTRRLREEQDAAYRAALEADQARERQRREEQERIEREAAEAERKRKEEQEALERAAREAAEKEAALERRRQEKALSLGIEPEKGPDVTQVLVRFPTGERKERRFQSSATIESLYDYVDSLGFLKTEKYKLVSNFPRVIYNTEKYQLSLREAGLHPHASLFVELDA